MLVEVRDARCDRHHDQKFSCNSSACLTLPAQIEALSGYDPPFDRLPWKTVGAKLQTAYSRMLLALEGAAVIRKQRFGCQGYGLSVGPRPSSARRAGACCRAPAPGG